MTNTNTKKLKKKYNAEKLETLCGLCKIPDAPKQQSDPWQGEINEFLRDTLELWTALLEGDINDTRDAVIERLVLHIQTRNENAGKPTHLNTLRVLPAYEELVAKLKDEGLTKAEAEERADAEFVADAELYGEVTR